MMQPVAGGGRSVVGAPPLRCIGKPHARVDRGVDEEECPMRRLVLLALALVLALGVAPLGPGLTGEVAAGDRYCPKETAYCAENAFLDFWRNNGGLEILGFPISQPFVDNRGLIVQFYERVIMEWHPENTDPRYQVLLTLLGNDLVANRPERNTPPAACDVTPCTLFTETNHTLRGAFYNYWVANGGLAVFGFPKTEQFVEVNQADGKPYTVQYFERNRFEYHPENAGTRYEVLLGLLGLESLNTQRAVLDRPVAQVPDYTVNVNAGVPVTLTIPKIAVDAPVEQVGLDALGNMDTPKQPWDTAWYSPGPRPGQRGNAVIAGHVDYHGIGPVVFWRLNEMQPGDLIYVTGDNGVRQRFVVTSVEIYLADDAPRERIFGGSDTANLNLISCTGDFDPGSASYNKRIVVYSRWDGVE
jgi:LPXTG-site transpeptidase (sortase) family protein